ncbi:MAG: phosphoribosylglycinamide formyltransferase [Candidatus Omnitrophica bacterium]|nr:phosphoribosylglycinamide formyltransferase [Candidatus Omnitrophota bacterium]MDD5737262.1 phosphoribosylglycinamide formyltransferase [Candidatus Omnitrophota bacterium]
MNFAVFCSGQGTNLQAIIDAVRQKRLKARLALVVCDNPKAFAVSRARRASIPVAVFDPKDFPSKKEMESAVIRELSARKIGLIALAGYMRILSDGFVRRYRNRIINIHPALLPAFKGGQAIKDAIQYGVKVTGPTVHFVTEEVDGGPIILQEACPVKDNDTEKTLLARVHKLEHKLYPEAIGLFARGKLTVRGRKVIVK